MQTPPPLPPPANTPQSEPNPPKLTVLIILGIMGVAIAAIGGLAGFIIGVILFLIGVGLIISGFAKYKKAFHSAREECNEALAKAAALEPLGKYQHVADAETEAARILENASNEELKIKDRAAQIEKESANKAEALLVEAKNEADNMAATATAMRNIIEGYGDRYLIPTRSLLDDLAEDFSHTDAGQHLKQARKNTRQMVKDRVAANCDYAEKNRRETAIRFVLDAFNGKVDSILSEIGKENHGTMGQQIRDAFTIVNKEGAAFRSARIEEKYLESRIEELNWAARAHALREQEREEQRRIKEQMREEERARREYERAIKRAEKDEETLRAAMDKARKEVENASAAERTKYEEQIRTLGEKLAIAEAKSQRAKSMAEQTKAGYVYIISNIGSFGEHVFKIGMTRRLDPMDRIYELGDASVPFEFDVHAMIYSENAPALENVLHERFDDMRINKVNYRKEYFRIPITDISHELDKTGHKVHITMHAEAMEYRESQKIASMTEAERENYLKNWQKHRKHSNSLG